MRLCAALVVAAATFSAAAASFSFKASEAARKHGRRLQTVNLPECYSEWWCVDYALPAYNKTTGEKTKDGLCYSKDAATFEVMFTKCALSCGFCSSECVNLETKAPEQCLDLTEADCYCDAVCENSPNWQEFSGIVTYKTNYCAESCGRVTTKTALPCAPLEEEKPFTPDDCSVANLKPLSKKSVGYVTSGTCDLPFIYYGPNGKSKVFWEPPKLGEADFRPYGATTFKKNQIKNNPDLRWCPLKKNGDPHKRYNARTIAVTTDSGIRVLGKNKNWGVVRCPSLDDTPTPSPTGSPTTPPTWSPTKKMPGALGEVLSEMIKTKRKKQKTGPVVLEGAFRVAKGNSSLSEPFEVSGELTIESIEAGGFMSCAFADSAKAPAITVKRGGVLNLKGVGFANCRHGVIAVETGGYVSVIDSTFDSNEKATDATQNAAVSNSGAVIATESPQTLISFTRCTFSRNTADYGGVAYFGASNSKSSASFNDCVFEDNYARFQGGAIAAILLLRVDDTKLYFKGSTFQRNSGKDAGVIYVQTEDTLRMSILFEDCNIEQNFARNEVGGVFFTLTRSARFAAHALDAAARATDLNTVRFKDSLIANNRAATEGGVGYVVSGCTTVFYENCNIENNEADDGGVHAVDYDQVSPDFANAPDAFVMMSGTEVVGNIARNRGGVNIMFPHTKATMVDSTVKRNEAMQGGVWYYVNMQNAFFRMTRVTVEGGFAHSQGGMAYISGGGDLKVENCTLSSTSAQQGGSIFAAVNGKVSIDGGSVSGNTATLSGGGAYLENNARLVAHRVLFDSNTAYREGGALHMTDRAYAELDACHASSNAAGYVQGKIQEDPTEGGQGGFASLQYSSKLVTVATSFSKNKAAFYGGALQLADSATIAATTSEFVDNSVGAHALGGGGAVAWHHVLGVADESQESFLKSCTFRGNTAFGGSVAVFVDAAYGNSVKNSLFGKYSESELNTQNPVKGVKGAALSTPPHSIFLVNDTRKLFVVSSGFPVPDFWIGMKDAFGNEIAVASDYTLALVPETENATKLEVSSPVGVFVFSVESKIDVHQVLIYTKEEGQNHFVTLKPSAEFHDEGGHYDSDRFWLKVPFFVDKCPDTHILVTPVNKYDQYNNPILQPYCVESKAVCEVGNFIDTSKLDPPHRLATMDELRSLTCTLCGLGTYRGYEDPGHVCKPCATGTVTTPNRQNCRFCEKVTQLSFNPKNESCDPCPYGANCLGGDIVIPLENSFSSATESYEFHPCINEIACNYPGRTQIMLDALNYARTGDLSALNHLNKTLEQHNLATIDVNAISNLTYESFQCNKGYQGPVCGSCSTGYARKSLYYCNECHSTGYTVMAFILALLLFSVFLLYMTIRSVTGKRSDTTHFKVCICWVQQIACLQTFKAQWPSIMDSVIGVFSSSATGKALSLSCLFRDTKMPHFTISAIVIIYVLPLFFLMFIPVIVKMVRSVSSKARSFSAPVTIDNLIPMVVVIYFLMYPFIFQQTVELFACLTVDKDHDVPYAGLSQSSNKGSYMLLDTEYKCWEKGGRHMQAVGIVGIPSLLGMLTIPFFVMWYLRKNLHRFKEPRFQKRWGFILLGIKETRWAWYNVMMIRTVVLALIGVLMYNYSDMAQLLVAQFWTAFYLVILFLLSPYKNIGTVRMEIVSTSSIFLVVYFQMWKINDRWANGDDGNDVLLSVAVFCTVVGTLLALFVMAMRSYVAYQTERDYRDISRKDVMKEMKATFSHTFKKTKTAMRKFTFSTVDLSDDLEDGLGRQESVTNVKGVTMELTELDKKEASKSVPAPRMVKTLSDV